jgi:tRNA A-37 threonylcarbamoyl transferase component Bud32
MSYAPSPALSQTQLRDLPAFRPGADGAPVFRPGTELLGRFRLEEEIGAGGMGRVYAAVDSLRQTRVAIKVLAEHIAQSEAAQKRFMAEAAISLQLSHPNIVRVYDIQQDLGRTFIVMELLSGRSLRQWMKSCFDSGTRMEVADVRRIATSLLDALVVAHAVTVHRDIKPENIIITGEGVVKLMDFGIAHAPGVSQFTHTTASLGTAYYMAPEQLTASGAVDARADLYSLGVVLYEMLSGSVPTGMARPVSALRPDVPNSLARAIEKALRPDAAERFQDAAQFIRAVRSGRIAGERWWAGHERAVRVAGGLTAAALVAGAATAALRSVDSEWLDEQLPIWGQAADRVRTQSVMLETEVKDMHRALEAERAAATRDPDREYATLLTDEVLSTPEWARIDGSMQLATLAIKEKNLRKGVRLLQDAKLQHQSATAAVRAMKPALALIATLKEGATNSSEALAPPVAAAVQEIESGRIFRELANPATAAAARTRLQEIQTLAAGEQARLAAIIEAHRLASEARQAAAANAQVAIRQSAKIGGSSPPLTPEEIEEREIAAAEEQSTRDKQARKQLTLRDFGGSQSSSRSTRHVGQKKR